jgi:hypothetical protein
MQLLSFSMSQACEVVGNETRLNVTITTAMAKPWAKRFFIHAMKLILFAPSGPWHSIETWACHSQKTRAGWRVHPAFSHITCN